jgi:hypothetical protein
MRVSVLLILITVGVPGCVSGAGASRPAADRYPTTGPTASAEPARAEPGARPHPATSMDAEADPHSGEPTGGGAAAPPADPSAAEPARRKHHWPPWRRVPAQGSPQATGPAAPPGAGEVPRDRAVPQEPRAGAAGRVVPLDQRSGSPPAADGLSAGYRRSLAWSGLLGLVISAVGLAMVGYRRRCW